MLTSQNSVGLGYHYSWQQVSGEAETCLPTAADTAGPSGNCWAAGVLHSGVPSRAAQPGTFM